MGSWSAKLYGSDAALDVKESFAVWARIPGSVDALVRAVTGTHPSARQEDDADYPTLWLALADQLHTHGLYHEEAFRRARRVITSGLDIATNQALGMEPRELKQRAAILDDHLQRWEKPHPRPKKRNLLRAPEPQAFEQGTVVAYPTCGGEAMNYADSSNRLGWFQDGWGSAIILATGHELGWFAWAAAGRLSVHGMAKPTLAQCLAASIESQPWSMSRSGKGTIAVQIAALAPLHAKRMGFEALGKVELDPAKVIKLHSGLGEPKRVPAATLHHVFTWWADGVQPLREKREPGLAVPGPVAKLAKLQAA